MNEASTNLPFSSLPPTFTPILHHLHTLCVTPILHHPRQLVEVPYGVPQGYRLSPIDDPTYFPGRCADIVVGDSSVGRMGVLHPEVVAAFDLQLPCAALEINVERFL